MADKLPVGSSADLERPLSDAKEAAGRALTIANSYPKGSKQYKSALADYNTAEAQLQAIQKQYDEAKTNEANQAKQKNTSTAESRASQAQSAVTKAEAELKDAQARANDFKNDPSAQALVKEKQKALDDAKAAAGKANDAVAVTKGSTTTTPAAPTTTDGKMTPAKGAPSVTPATTNTGTKTAGASKTSTSASKKTTTTPPPPPPNTADAMTALEAKYGVQAALVDSDKSLKALFEEAQKKGYTGPEFKAAFQNTDWAKARSESAQQAETARLESPATYTQAYNGMRNYLARLAVTMGENLSPADLGGEYDPAKGRQNNLVETALDQQWGAGLDETKMRQLILSKAKLNTALPGGEAGGYMSQLKGLANDYGMNSLTTNGSQWLTDNAQAILLGKKDINTVKQEVIDQAKLNYKPYASQLDAGVTLRGIATPYLNTLSNLLEVPTDSIDLSSPTGYGKMVSNALMGTDPTNPTPMTLNAFETQVKQDPRWASTNNARDTVMGGVGGLLKLLGKVS